MSELTAECIVLEVNASDGDCGGGLRYHDGDPNHLPQSHYPERARSREDYLPCSDEAEMCLC